MNFGRLFNRRTAGSPSGPGLMGLLNRTIQALGVHLHVRAANAWRDQWNPLRGLTIARAVSYLEAGERGEYADLQWLYRMLEKRCPVTKGLVERYEGGLLKLDWEIRMKPEEKWPKGATPELAAEQSIALREAYERIDNLRDATQFLVLSEFRGFAHLEKWRGEDGAVTHLEPVPQWHWVRDGINGEWLYNREARSGTRRGELIELSNFMVRECCRPVNEIGLLNFVFSNMGKKDWASFVEVYGIPWLFLIGPPNIPQGKEAEYQDIAEKIISDARGYLPHGSDVKTGESGQRGTNPFKEFINFLREEVVLAGTGGKLTMLTESGSGTLAGGAHQDAWDDIVAGKARMLSECFQRQLDGPEVLERLFPGRPALAYFEICSSDEEDATKEFKRKAWLGFQQDGTLSDVLANSVELKSLTEQVGLPVNEEYVDPYVPVRDDKGNLVTGGVIRDEENDIVGGEAEAGNSQSPIADSREPGQLPAEGKPASELELANRALPHAKDAKGAKVTDEELLLTAMAADFERVRQEFMAVMQIEDGQLMMQRLAELPAQLEKLKADINRAPRSQRALYEIMLKNFFNGMEEAGSASKQKMAKS
jgi:hypothetical protein